MRSFFIPIRLACWQKSLLRRVQPVSRLRLTSKCAFFEGGRGGDDPNGGKYVQMEIELVVQDREGNRSAPVRQPIRMYPNRMCGFNY